MNVEVAFRSILLAAGLAIQAPQASPVPEPAQPQIQMSAAWTLPLRTQEALDAYLHDHAGKPTPFDALPPGARERFFLSLYWGLSGLGSMDIGILADELPQPQIEAILRLFGEDLAEYAPRSRLPAGALPAAANGEISDLEQRYNDFYRIQRNQDQLDDATLAAQLAERFDALADAYVAQTLRGMDHRHLAMLWNAASVSATLSSEPRYVEAMEAVLAETERRDAGNPPDHRIHQLRNALLAARRFEDAQHIAGRYPDADLPPLPDLVDPFANGEQPARSAWILSTDGDSLTRQPIDLAGTTLLVVSTYGCGFSRNAAEDIAADPVLGPAFAERATWLMPPPGRERIEGALEWNRLYPQAPARLIYDRKEWPILPEWVTPVFHIVRDGRIVDTVTGWPRGEENHREALLEMLRRHGLIDPAAPTP